MPPKGAGKAKRKAAVAELFEKGASNHGNADEEVKVITKQIQNMTEISEDVCPELVKNGQANDLNGIIEDSALIQKGEKGQDKNKDKKTTKSDKENEAATKQENNNTLEEIQDINGDKTSTEEPVTKKRGRKPQNPTESVEDPPLRAEENISKKTRGGRNAKQQSVEAASKEDESKAEEILSKNSKVRNNTKQKSTDIDTERANQEIDETKPIDEELSQEESLSKKISDKTNVEPLPETKEIVPKKTKGVRNVRKQSVDVDSNVDQNGPAPKAGKNLPKKKGVHNARRASTDVNVEDDETKATESIENAEQEDAVPDMYESAPPKKRRAARSARQHSEYTSPQKANEVAQKKSRGGRLFRQPSVDALREMKVSSQRGRKRLNAVRIIKNSNSVESTSREEADFDVKRECRVSILRQQSLDDLALENLKEAETKSKAAKGSAKTSGRGKRAASEDGGDGKLAKVPKEASKSSKKEKIPDVTALDFTNQSSSPDGKPWNLKIATWNVNGIRAWLEKDGLSYMRHEQPDMLCIQETKCAKEKLPKEVANFDGYNCYWLAGDKDGYSGVGLLSKKKPLSVEYGIGQEEHDQEGRVITAEYDQFYLVGTYVPNAGRGLVRLKYREQWDVDFRTYLKKLDEKKPVILCGDLNVAHEEIDLANPRSNKKNAGFTKEERDAFSTLLSEGFVDTFRHLYPNQKGAYTFWTYMMNSRGKNVGWRLDYFVISKRLTDHLCDSVIRKDVMGSDHCPASLFLNI